MAPRPDDDRDHKPRYENDRRSRSPRKPNARDDNNRRRDRSPFRGGKNSRGRGRGGGRGGGAPPGRDYNNDSRGRDRETRAPNTDPFHHGNARGGSRHNPDSRQNGGRGKAPPAPEVDMTLQEGEDEEAMLRRVMGFQGFRSTKNTKVPGNDKNYAVSKVKKAEYRQYMNRVGGFNRPLSPSRITG
ncbi:hypothetical protein LTR56_020271 [Elasticomyces elasticus]|nr:hypothetical protein LTR56_020271 [Elasticomyces elasticus]KAK3644539.1 hypothetical protein LTR22_015137 [Elasticomyces elasticus]KAK4910391.1 hypothetical protein LTR49_020907 [Elasticomyces elasticus]KAK5750056.1 hypothetical protein LTS12_019861 [Elasticomyces elasticus]